VAKEEPAHVLAIDGREVRISNPSKLYFSRDRRLTKLELVQYYLAVAEGALRGIRDRPVVLKRFVNGAEGEAFYQKRAPDNHPAWLRTVTLRFPSGRTAEELVVDDPAGLAWIVNLGCIELHPHPVRSAALEHPDELRVDLDPTPGTTWEQVRRVALEVKALFDEHGLPSWPKTSGSRGIHIYVRIQPRWSFTEVRRAALAISREIERRAPTLATSKWWKEERHGVFLDYNQNAKDRTTCSAYSVRPLPDARVSTPLRWDEVPDCEPADFTVATVPARLAKLGDPHAAIDEVAASLESLLELAARDEAAGLGDAPWPPHYRKMEGEAPRVSPSRKKGAAAAKKTPRVKLPLLTIANSPSKEAALAGLERWRARHPEVSARLAVEDVLVDSMRGRSSTWTRIRVNLKNVPEELRPPQETPDPDDDPTREWREKWKRGKRPT
jgi:bifunctional non-homologous end joining protein LigD